MDFGIKMDIITKISEKLAYLKYKKLAHQSWSQYGEDILLDHLVGRKQYGFYIDVGAYHPFEFSNTYKFYQRGWRGINIDANEESILLFNSYRIKDINICAAVSDKEEELGYVKYDGPASNHLTRDGGDTHIVLKTNTLSSILGTIELPSVIDFMSVDVEGYDLNVLISNDWNKCRPNVLLVEDNNIENLFNLDNNLIVMFMDSKNYTLVSKLFNTLVFKRN